MITACKVGTLCRPDEIGVADRRLKMQKMGIGTSQNSRGLIWCSAVCAGIMLLAVLLISIQTNNGIFTYPGDDAYIHLTVSKNIFLGHYGLNLNEPSSPSSSIIWPFLIAPFGWSGMFLYVPLIYNFLLTMGAAGTLSLCFAEILKSQTPKLRFWLSFALTMAMMLALGMVPIAFIGLEHSLQIFVTFVIALGLIRFHRYGELKWYLIAAIILAPLVRYESTVLSAAASLWLISRGKRLQGSISLVAAVGLLALFGVFLVSLGLPPLPSSVLTKSAVADRAVGLKGIPPTPEQLSVPTQSAAPKSGAPKTTTAASVSASDPESSSSKFGNLAIFAFVFLILGFNRRNKGLLGLYAVVGFSLLAQWLLAPHTASVRLESYAFGFGTVMLLFFRVEAEDVLMKKTGPLATSAILFLLMAMYGRPAIQFLEEMPISTASIYRQQYQMMRFVRDYYKGPVALNDIGIVSYEGGQYVLDVWGLASIDALRAKFGNPDGDWVTVPVDRKKVGLVMIYDSWITKHPTSWKKIGDLVLSGPQASVADSRVGIYATQWGNESRIRTLLEQFSKTLPTRATIEWSH